MFKFFKRRMFGFKLRRAIRKIKKKHTSKYNKVVSISKEMIMDGVCLVKITAKDKLESGMYGCLYVVLSGIPDPFPAGEFINEGDFRYAARYKKNEDYTFHVRHTGLVIDAPHVSSDYYRISINLPNYVKSILISEDKLPDNCVPREVTGVSGYE